MKFIMKVSEIFSSVVLISLFFLIINLTTWLNLVALVYADQRSEWILSSVLLAFNFIFILFPSITALTATSREWVINQTFKVNPLMFFRLFVRNFKNSLIPGAIIILMFIVFSIDLIYFKSYSTTLEYFFTIVLLLTGYLTLTSTIVLSHFEIKGKKVILKAVQLLLYPPLFLTLGGLTILGILVSNFIGVFYTALFISFFIYLMFSGFYRQHLNVIGKLTQN